ncbi:MAG: DUF3300 domain-containing protein [Beijerinckiaceae bacterium]
MDNLRRLSRGALVGALATAAFVAAPFAVASGHRQPPPRVLIAQADGAATPAAEAPAPVQAPMGAPAPAAAPPAAPPPAAPVTAQPAPVPPPPPQGEPPAAGQASAETYSRAEIEKLVAPVALYPDALLAQLLAATAYPLDVVQAARWIERNRAAVGKQDFSGADQQKWDESVKALVRFPEVIRKLNDDVDWMTDLGEAFVNQPKEVADAIQDLRERAEAKGALKDSEHQRVARRQDGGRNYVVIEPVNPQRIYVPVYDPVALWWPPVGYVWGGGPWVTWPYYGLLAGVVPAAFYWGWNSGWVYPPFWPGYRGWRPGLAYAGVGPRRWAPNPARFRPELVSKRSNEAIRRYGATSAGGRRIQQMNAQQRTQRATRELTRAGGRQQVNRASATRQNVTRAQTNRSRNVASQNRMTRQQATRANRASMNRASMNRASMNRTSMSRVNRASINRSSMRVQRGPSMGARSMGGSRGAVRSSGGRRGR